MPDKEFHLDHPKKENAARCPYTDDCGAIFTAEELLRTDGVDIKKAINDLCVKYGLKLSVTPPRGSGGFTGWDEIFRGQKDDELKIKIVFPKPVPEDVMKTCLKGLAELSWGCTATESVPIEPSKPEKKPKPQPKPIFANDKNTDFFSGVFVGDLLIGKVTDIGIDQGSIEKAKEKYRANAQEKRAAEALNLSRELAVMELNPDPLQDRDW